MRNKIFIIIIGLLFMLGFSSFVFGQREGTILERRKLNTIDDIETCNLIESINVVLNDQFFFRDQSIVAINIIKELSNSLFNNTLLKINDDVIKLDDNYYINEYTKLTDWDKHVALNRAYNIREISEKYPDLGVYVYFPTRIEETSLLDMEGMESIYPDLKNEFLIQLGGDVKSSSLKIETIDDFRSYYYKTDHHWNGMGIYEGYKDIVNLINQDYDIGLPKKVETKEYSYDFYGSYAQKIAFICNPDKLIDFQIETNEYKYFIDGKLSDDEEYRERYLRNGNSQPEYTDYEIVYGSNDFERIYDFNQLNKPNILIFSDSYINPLKKAIASHFNKTIIIDMRANDGQFSLDEYINKYNIDAILFLQYYEDLYFNGYLFVPLN